MGVLAEAVIRMEEFERIEKQKLGQAIALHTRFETRGKAIVGTMTEYVEMRELRVAEGIYKPDEGTGQTPGDRFATFELVSGLTLKGGYAGIGHANPNDRNVDVYKTFLTGDLAGNDSSVRNVRLLGYDPNRIDNSYHVVSAIEVQNTIVDGFYIESGHANGDEEDDINHSNGGGFYCSGGSPQIMNCLFSQNTCSEYGATIYLRSCTAEIAYCEIYGNSTPDDGGGIFISGSEDAKCSPFINNCIIRNNWAGDGSGGIRCDDYTEPIIRNCIIAGNASGDEGGGISCKWTCWPQIENCTIVGNSSVYGGGIHCIETDVNMVNCIVWANTAKHGNQIALSQSNYFITRLSVLHCCIQEDREGVYLSGGCTPEWPYSDTTTEPYWNPNGRPCGLSWLSGNIVSDPCFADLGFWDKNGTPSDPTDDHWIHGDYHLKSKASRWDVASMSWVGDEVASPCIDAGSPLSDVGDEPTPNGGNMNMGAYGGTLEASKSQ